MSDPELARLLLLEIARHLAALERSPLELVEARRALHALKGSLGLAGEGALAQEIRASSESSPPVKSVLRATLPT